MKVITDFPIAYDSPDHIFPWGTRMDNTTDHGFIAEIEAYFHHKKINMMDIGCSGGQLVIDFNARGHKAIGLEGSDYSVQTARANWPAYHNKFLFTCNAAKPYKVTEDNGEEIKFDLITAWETIEHIHPDELDVFFQNICNHMSKDGIFCGSIALNTDVIEGHVLHQSVFPAEKWMEEILPKYFKVHVMPFYNKVRGVSNNIHVMLELK